MIDLRASRGSGIRVAIVDSGVVDRHPHVGPVAAGFGVDPTPDGPRLSERFDDVAGHGTACAGVVRWGAPDAAIVAARVLDARLTARADALELALDALVARRVAIVNLSLGVPDQEARARLAPVTDRLTDAGVLIVSAVRPDGRPSWPSDDARAFDVAADPSLSRWQYRAGGPGEATFVAAPTPRPIPGRPETGNYSGTSFAAPRIAALLARALAIDPTLTRDTLIDVLIANAPHFDHTRASS